MKLNAVVRLVRVLRGVFASRFNKDHQFRDQKKQADRHHARGKHRRPQEPKHLLQAEGWNKGSRIHQTSCAHSNPVAVHRHQRAAMFVVGPFNESISISNYVSYPLEPCLVPGKKTV
jgi:hypothetical protein